MTHIPKEIEIHKHIYSFLRWFVMQGDILREGEGHPVRQELQ